MKRLTRNDGIDAAARQIRLLGGAVAPADARMLLCRLAHARVGLDRDDGYAALRKEPSRDARAGANIGDRQRLWIAETVERRINRTRRIRRAKGRICLRTRTESCRWVHRQVQPPQAPCIIGVCNGWMLSFPLSPYPWQLPLAQVHRQPFPRPAELRLGGVSPRAPRRHPRTSASSTSSKATAAGRIRLARLPVTGMARSTVQPLTAARSAGSLFAEPSSS